MNFLLFIFGASIGSFLNVVSLRYEPERFLLSPKIIGGRSHCPKCKKTLHWFELIPLLSFIVQGGRCRNCKASLNFQYPFVEILSGLIFVFIPCVIYKFGLPPAAYYLLSAIWIFVFLTLLLITLIDARLSIIPDEANVFLGVLGLISLPLINRLSDSAQGSFLGSFSSMFSFSTNVWVSHVSGAFFALLVFGAIIIITRGRGMGMGDVKLVAPLGLLFGWPDIILLVALSFIIGSIFGVYVMIFKHKNLKSAVPFGPFLALAATVVFFSGYDLIKFYFDMFVL